MGELELKEFYLIHGVNKAGNAAARISKYSRGGS